MLALFNTDRELTRLAADAAHIARMARTDEQPWRRAAADRRHQTLRPGLRDDQPSAGSRIDRDRMERLIEVAVVGDPSALCDVLTPDAVGWSPTLRFSSRGEAEAALCEGHACLSIPNFSIDGLWWNEFDAFAEWSAEVVPTGPFLVGDDVLVEAEDRRVSLVGASAALLAGDRIAAIHTYFDDASVIEQLLLDPP